MFSLCMEIQLPAPWLHRTGQIGKQERTLTVQLRGKCIFVYPGIFTWMLCCNLSPNTLTCAHAYKHTHTHTVRSLFNNLTSYIFAFSLQIVPTPAYNAHPLFPNYLKPIRHSMLCCNVVTSMKPSLMALAKPALSPLSSPTALEVCSMLCSTHVLGKESCVSCDQRLFVPLSIREQRGGSIFKNLVCRVPV